MAVWLDGTSYEAQQLALSFLQVLTEPHMLR